MNDIKITNLSVRYLENAGDFYFSIFKPDGKLSKAVSCRDVLMEDFVKSIKAPFKDYFEKTSIVIGFNKRFKDNENGLNIERILNFLSQIETAFKIPKSVCSRVNGLNNVFCFHPHIKWFTTSQMFSLYLLVLRGGIFSARNKNLEDNLKLINSRDPETFLYNCFPEEDDMNGSLSDGWYNTPDDFSICEPFIAAIKNYGIKNIFSTDYEQNWELVKENYNDIGRENLGVIEFCEDSGESDEPSIRDLVFSSTLNRSLTKSFIKNTSNFGKELPNILAGLEKKEKEEKDAITA